MGCICAQSVHIKTSSTRPTIRVDMTESKESMATAFLGDITTRYHFGETLGCGQYGTVRLAQSVYHSDEMFAVKTISLKRLGSTLDEARNEIAILFSLDHPNIIRLYEVYEEKRYFHLVTEYCSGGELFDKLVSKGHYQESEAEELIKKVLSAVNYLHGRNICHRDIKPENFMFESGELKLIDFGLAATFHENEIGELSSQVGTPYYVAPEVLSGAYNSKCDIWSVGIMLFLLITGSGPYVHQSTEQLFDEIASLRIDFSSPALTSVSPMVQDLLKKLLAQNPADRPTALEALAHPWFQQTSVKELRLDPVVLFSLKRFKATSRLKLAALNLLARRLSVKKKKELNEMFTMIDRSNSGIIDFNNLKKALSDAGFNLTEPEINTIMDNVAYDGIGRIGYSDFLAATLVSKQPLFSETALKSVFCYFDKDRTGYITRKGFQETMQRSGRLTSEEEAAGIIAEADVFNEGKISFAAFKQVLKRGG